MSQLISKTCEVCQIGAPLATESEIKEFMPQIPDWAIQEDEHIKQLIRCFNFDTYMQGLSFTHSVGELAESEDHHPKIITEWGKVTVVWWTHKIKGLHVNDFVLAAKTDKLLSY